MATASEEKRELEKHIKESGGYKKEGDDLAASEFFNERKQQLIKGRQNIVNQDIENVWRAADRAYIPHNLVATGNQVFASNDELGWRSLPITLGKTDDWQEDSVPVNPYIKIQTALGILIDRNPNAVFKAFAKQFEGASKIHSELYKRNWDIANSKEQLKVIILNGAKYGVIAGVTSVLKIQRNVRDLVEYFPSNPSKNKYEKRNIEIYDDVYRWALNPWTTWFDDKAKPGDPFSLNDWMRFKDFSWERFREQFGYLQNFKFIKPQDIVGDDLHTQESSQPTVREGKLKNNVVRLWFYENLERDMFYVESDDGIVLINEPIPHLPRNKRLSSYSLPWHITYSHSALLHIPLSHR